MKRFIERLEQHWFAPSDAHDLGVFRALIGLWLLYTWFERLRPRLWSFVDRPSEFALPPSFLSIVHLPLPVPAALIAGVTWIFPLLCLALVAGVFVRPVLARVTLLYWYFEGSLSAWGYTSHSTILPALELVILCFAPGVSTFSVDAWRKGEAHVRGVPSMWPVRLALLLTALLYFASGLSKLRYSGLSWLDGQTLGFYVGGGSLRGVGAMQAFIASSDVPEAARFRDGFGLVDFTWVARPVSFGPALAEHGALMAALSTAAVIMEITFPLALLGRRILLGYLVCAALFHLGVDALLSIDFGPYVLAYAIFFDLGRPARWLKAKVTRTAP